ncbi:hypothetical protein PR202_gb06819 [Eleusine coracana subsp. coracana]|uniref:Uncharacterized protein n=1 Tax=Eleusine coracana subsp. coracana TaxID=191504 RepID=A0AAV5EAF1_ELECO|nr:hypothetical protein PR202_gb06819 [Eleusine coracana subsp. coracana]
MRKKRTWKRMASRWRLTRPRLKKKARLGAARGGRGRGMTWRRRGTSLRSLDGSAKAGTSPPAAKMALRAMRPRRQAMARLRRWKENLERAASGAGELMYPQRMRDAQGRQGKQSAVAAR